MVNHSWRYSASRPRKRWSSRAAELETLIANCLAEEGRAGGVPVPARQSEGPPRRAQTVSLNDLPPADNGKNGWPWGATGSVRQRPAGAESEGELTFTIVTPSLNQGEFIEETMRSLLAQQVPVEYVVMDGGSTDGTLTTIGRYESWLSWWRSGPDAGQSDAINQGMAMGTGEICGWLCSDDVLAPDALLHVQQYFTDHPECRWLAGAADFVKPNGDFVDHSKAGLDGEMALLDYWRWGMAGHALPQAACFWRRSLWDEVGGLTVGNELAMDFELWLKFSERSDLHVLPLRLATCKVHRAAKTQRLSRQLYAARRRCAFAAAKRRGVWPGLMLWRKLVWTFAWRIQRMLRRRGATWPLL